MTSTTSTPATVDAATTEYTMKEEIAGYAQSVTARCGGCCVEIERRVLLTYAPVDEDVGKHLDFLQEEAFYLSIDMPTDSGLQDVFVGSPEQLRSLGDLVALAIAEATRRGVLPAAGAVVGGAHVGA